MLNLNILIASTKVDGGIFLTFQHKGVDNVVIQQVKVLITNTVKVLMTNTVKVLMTNTVKVLMTNHDLARITLDGYSSRGRGGAKIQVNAPSPLVPPNEILPAVRATPFEDFKESKQT